MDDLHRHWHGFLAALRTADAGSFSQAARQLNLTPAAVGKSVAQLEAHLGVRLFNRTTRQLALTQEGERVVAQVRAAWQALAQAGEVAGPDQALQGRVRISCAVGFGRRFVLPALAQVLQAHPQLQVELSLSDQHADLVREGFDIGIRGGSTPPQGMVAQTICLAPLVLVASPAYLQAHGTPSDWQALAAHRRIGVRFASGRVAAWSFRADGVTRNLDQPPQWWLSAPEAAVDAALLHQGIARVALHHAADALQQGLLLQVLVHQHVADPVAVAMFYPHRAGLAPRVRAMVDGLLQALRADPVLRSLGAGPGPGPGPKRRPAPSTARTPPA